MIGKQFLVTAIFMACVAVLLSVLFRIQIGWPGESSSVLSFFLGDTWAPNGILHRGMYLGLVTIHGTIMVFFVLTGGLSGVTVWDKSRNNNNDNYNNYGPNNNKQNTDFTSGD